MVVSMIQHTTCNKGIRHNIDWPRDGEKTNLEHHEVDSSYHVSVHVCRIEVTEYQLLQNYRRYGPKSADINNRDQINVKKKRIDLQETR